MTRLVTRTRNSDARHSLSLSTSDYCHGAWVAGLVTQARDSDARAARGAGPSVTSRLHCGRDLSTVMERAGGALRLAAAGPSLGRTRAESVTWARRTRSSVRDARLSPATLGRTPSRTAAASATESRSRAGHPGGPAKAATPPGRRHPSRPRHRLRPPCQFRAHAGSRRTPGRPGAPAART